MIAKALLATDQPTRAMVSADHCLEVCQANGLGDFDLAYAHEARSRALLALGQHAEARQEWLSASAVEVADAEDRAIVVADFADLARSLRRTSRSLEPLCPDRSRAHCPRRTRT